MAPEDGAWTHGERKIDKMMFFSFLRKPIALFLISFFVVAVSQPDWSLFACIVTSSIGYALFWKSISAFKRKFFLSLFWFGGVQLVHLNWFFSDRYVGIYIYPVLLMFSVALGIQFGLLTVFIGKGKDLTSLRILAGAGGYAILEWGRLFVLSGFTWNPMGLALSATFYGLQFVSLFGVFGLTFWIILTNLFALKWLENFSLKRVEIWLAAALLPYIFGFGHSLFHSKNMDKEDKALKTLLVQTSIDPEEKISINGSEPLSPLVQWERILSLIYDNRGSLVDLIVLSEGVVPYGTDFPIYQKEAVKHSFESFFGASDYLPETQAAYVGNSYWAQGLANLFNADVAIGLEDVDFTHDKKMQDAYNAAFLFHPFSPRDRYEKRVLLPISEYVPFDWCRKIMSEYGIEGAYTHGKEVKVFTGKEAKISLSICYEETFGNLMRKSRKKGANVLVNLSNDVWYPCSRLPYVHFLHGRLRSVENGMPILRSCNTGVTCGVDSLGRVVDMLEYEKIDQKSPRQTLSLSLPLYSYPTLYTFFGDWPIILFSFFSLILFAFNKIKVLKVNEINISLLRKN